MTFPPTLFLIGAQKAGTTSLANYLDEHPSICLADPKEPHYFTNNWKNGEDWYRSRYKGKESSAILLDASTSYTMARLGESEHVGGNPYFQVPERIHSMAPEARFIYMLREPVARTYSAYWHSVRNGAEKRSFEEAVINDINDNNYYLRPSNYWAQLERFLRVFPASAFLVLLFEDFKNDYSRELRRCFEFTGVDTIEVEMDRPRNQSFVPRGLGKLLVYSKLRGAAEKVRPLIPNSLEQRLKRMLTDRVPQMLEQQRSVLADYFREPNQRIEAFLGRRIVEWDR
jgi:hypothetical protein